MSPGGASRIRPESSSQRPWNHAPAMLSMNEPTVPARLMTNTNCHEIIPDMALVAATHVAPTADASVPTRLIAPDWPGLTSLNVCRSNGRPPNAPPHSVAHVSAAAAAKQATITGGSEGCPVIRYKAVANIGARPLARTCRRRRVLSFAADAPGQAVQMEDVTRKTSAGVSQLQPPASNNSNAMIAAATVAEVFSRRNPRIRTAPTMTAIR